MLSPTSSDIQGLCSDLPSTLNGPKICWQCGIKHLASIRLLVAFVLSSLPHWQIHLFAIQGAWQVTAVSLQSDLKEWILWKVVVSVLFHSLSHLSIKVFRDLPTIYCAVALVLGTELLLCGKLANPSMPLHSKYKNICHVRLNFNLSNQRTR